MLTLTPCPINPREIHLWHARYVLSESHWELLSLDEKKRAEQFHFEKDQSIFVFSRAKLRTILSQYSDIAPNLLRFHYTAHGKPFLDPMQNPYHLQFNVSHSREVVTYAISRDEAVGVDVEYMNMKMDYLAIAKNFFSPHEYAYLQNVGEQGPLFYRIWTCKEAFIKAIGFGLSYALTDFDVGDFSDTSAKILRIQGDETAGNTWSLFHWMPFEDYCAALAVRLTGAIIKFCN